MAVAQGRAARPGLKIGICGEHGGDPASVKFCHAHRARLRFVLALPRADRPPGGGAGGARGEGGDREGMKVLILSRRRTLYSTRRLVETARHMGHRAVVVDPLNCFIVCGRRDPSIYHKNSHRRLGEVDVVLPRIGASITEHGLAVVRQFSIMGIPIVNNSVPIARSRDKLRSLQLLSRHDIDIPRTVMARAPSQIARALDAVGGPPVILKLIQGSQGVGVMLAETLPQLEAILDTLWGLGQNILIQEFIAESRGRDIRALVVGGRVVGAMRRIARLGEFRSNIHRGGAGRIIELSEEYAQVAVRGMRGDGAAGRGRGHARIEVGAEGDRDQLLPRLRRARAGDARGHRPRDPRVRLRLRFPAGGGAGSHRERKARMSPPKDLTIAGRVIRPGETQEILLKISEFYTAQPVNIPVTVMRGEEEGNRVFLTAAIHGDELNGVEIVRSVIQGLDHSKIKGTLICLPVVNRMGFLNHTRYLPDRTDLNRHFPGDAQGNSADRIADILFRQIVSQCDFGIDFHTAAVGRTNLPHIRAKMDDDKVRQIAKAFGTEVVVDRDGHPGSLRSAATAALVPTVIYEGGETFKFQRKEIRKGISGVYNVLSALGMIPTPLKEPRLQVVVRKTEWVRAERGGILDLSTAPGDVVYEKEPLAVIENPFGREVSSVTAPFTGLILGTTTRPMVNPGDAICHLVKLDKTLPTVEKHLIRLASGRRRIPIDV